MADEKKVEVAAVEVKPIEKKHVLPDGRSLHQES